MNDLSAALNAQLAVPAPATPHERPRVRVDRPGFELGFAGYADFAHAYGEEAFHYFLELERRRSEVSRRPFLLMLIDFRKHPGVEPPLDHSTAGKLFTALSHCLRETDFTGWYREGRVAGAVLTQHDAPGGDDLSHVVQQRVCGELEKQLGATRAGGLQVRVYHVSPSPQPAEERS
jgi:hypothetical protein